MEFLTIWRVANESFFSFSRFMKQVLTCGPPPMKRAIIGHLEKLGFSEDMHFEF